MIYTAFDEKNLILYVTLFQIFRIWFIPFDSAPVHLTTVLRLTTSNPEAPTTQSSTKSKRYWIIEQTDLYQTDQFMLFVSPYRVGYFLCLFWQCVATAVCVVMSIVCYPFTWAMDNVVVHHDAKKIEAAKE